jgi:hypothetical protein
MTDDKNASFKFFLLSNVHTMLLSTTFLAKPMFRVNKPLLISKQTMRVTWQNIPRFVI